MGNNTCEFCKYGDTCDGLECPYQNRRDGAANRRGLRPADNPCDEGETEAERVKRTGRY